MAAKQPSDLSKVTSALDKVLDVLETIAPVAKQFDAVANVATIAIAASQIGRNILDRAEGGALVLNSQDEAKIRASLEELQRANDRLASDVASS